MHSCELGFTQHWNEPLSALYKTGKGEFVPTSRSKRTSQAFSCVSERIYVFSSASGLFNILKAGPIDGVFRIIGVTGMLGGKDYSAMDILFQFVAFFTSQAMVYSACPGLLKVHKIQLDLLSALLFRRESVLLSERDCGIFWYYSRANEVCNAVFQSFWTFQPVHAVKFHLLDNDCDDLPQFSDLLALNASGFEHLSFISKNLLKMILKKKIVASRRGWKHLVWMAAAPNFRSLPKP